MWEIRGATKGHRGAQGKVMLPSLVLSLALMLFCCSGKEPVQGAQSLETNIVQVGGLDQDGNWVPIDRTVINMTSVRFEFECQPEPESCKFECGLDQVNWTACNTPFEIREASEGDHLFRVRARRPKGWIDETPAEYKWRLDTTPPTFSGIDRIERISRTGVELHWQRASDDKTPSEQVKYAVCRSKTAESCALNYPAPRGSFEYSYYLHNESPWVPVPGLSENVTEYFGVRAEDEAGNRDSNIKTIAVAGFNPSTCPSAVWEETQSSPDLYGMTSIQHVDDTVVVSVGAKGAVIRTDDGGKTWTRMRTAVLDDFLSLEFLPGGKTGFVAGVGGVLLKTNDGGRTWQRLNSGTRERIYALSFLDPDHGYAVGGRGTILGTQDGGTRWTVLSSGVESNLYDVEFPGGRSIGYAVGDSATVLKTDDDGRTWRILSIPTACHPSSDTPCSTKFLSVTFPVGDPSVGYVAGTRGRGYRTTDGGATWKRAVIVSQATGSEGSILDIPDAENFHDVDFPSGSQVGFALIGGGGSEVQLFKSIDGGTGWRGIYSYKPFPFPDLVRLAFNQDAAVGFALAGDSRFVSTAIDFMPLAIATPVFKTTDGGKEWAKMTGGEIDEPLERVRFAPSGIGIAAGADSVFRTDDWGRRWKNVTPPANFKNPPTGATFHDDKRKYQMYFSVEYHAIDLLRESRLAIVVGEVKENRQYYDSRNKYTQGEYGVAHRTPRLLVSKDFGETWAVVDISGPDSGLVSVSIASNPLVAFAAGGKGVVFRTLDGGQTWTPLDVGIKSDLSGVSFPSDGSVGYVVGRNGAVYRTDDAGEHWTRQTVGGEWDLNSIHCPSGPADCYVSSSGGMIFKTIDGGASWSRLDSGIPDRLGQVTFLDRDVGFVLGEEAAVFSTKDGGHGWSCRTVGTPVLSGIQALSSSEAVAAGSTIAKVHFD